MIIDYKGWKISDANVQARGLLEATKGGITLWAATL